MRRLTTICGALALILGGAMTTHALLIPMTQPASTGSSLIYYYDTRAGFTTFVNITHFGLSPITVEIDYWGPTFQTKVPQSFTLEPGVARVIDVGALMATNDLGAQQGIAIASVVNVPGTPIEVPILTGNFTVANLATGSAWGAPAAARSARKAADGSFVPSGTIVDGKDVVYQSIQSQFLILASFYDPQTLAPVSAHGSQMIFINFKDAKGLGTPLTAGTTSWEVNAARAGQSTADTVTTVVGVAELDLVSLIGDDANGGTGTVFFRTTDPDIDDTRLIFFAQSLGTFGTGYLLPPVL